MRKVFLILFSILITSCSVTNYYQVYKADSENGIIKNNNIVFEDQNCKVSYNLWSEGGNVGFEIYNKSESDKIGRAHV